MDFFIRATHENVDRLRALRAAYGADPHIDEIRAADLLGEYAVSVATPEALDRLKRGTFTKHFALS